MTICLLDYVCFKEMIAINLCKQQALGTDPEAIQQINFTGNLDWANTTLFFIIEGAKETILGFSQETESLFWVCFVLI